MFWGWLWGIAGALIAVPLLVGLRSVCKRNRRWGCSASTSKATEEPPSLRSLVRLRSRRRPVPPAG